MADTTSATTLTLAWGNSPEATASGQYEARAESSDDIVRVIERVNREIATDEVAEQINVWAGSWSKGDETPKPLIQVMVGHRDRASIFWHEGDHSYQVVDETLPPLAEDIVYERSGQGDTMPPEATQVHPATVARVLTAFLHTGARPSDITWQSL
jgi:hypothetical protein